MRRRVRYAWFCVLFVSVLWGVVCWCLSERYAIRYRSYKDDIKSLKKNYNSLRDSFLFLSNSVARLSDDSSRSFSADSLLLANFDDDLYTFEPYMIARGSSRGLRYRYFWEDWQVSPTNTQRRFIGKIPLSFEVALTNALHGIDHASP